MASSVKELHCSLRMAFRLDADADPFIKKELEQMFSDFGPDRSSQAIQQFIRSEQFFSIAKMREYVPASVEPAQHLYDSNCEFCDEGWQQIGWDQFRSKYRNKLIELYGFEKAQTMTARQRCTCWRGPQAEAK